MENLLDMAARGPVEVRIRADRNVLWINTEQGCVLRVSQISNLKIKDESRSKTVREPHDQPCHELGLAHTRAGFEDEQPFCSECGVMLCDDCNRAITYREEDESWHHLEAPKRGCFLIGAE